MNRIIDIDALEILDSRGFPTIRTTVLLDNGISGVAMVPSGASTGEREAFELRDNDEGRYLGKGVLKAVNNVKQKIAPALKGLEVHKQNYIDQLMIDLDGTPQKKNLGANSILSVSLAVAHASANANKTPLFKNLNKDNQNFFLPVPLMNVINGGQHANNNIDFQEFMIVPHGASCFSESLRYGAEVFQKLKSLIEKMGMSSAVGDEGGFAPNLDSNEHALSLILDSIESAGYIPGEDISIALDVASSEFYKDNLYHINSEGLKLNSEEMCDFLSKLVKNYPIVSIEDGMDQNDWIGWQKLTSLLGNDTQLVGDDLFVTNVKFLQKGINEKSANSILIKVNQIGTLSETQSTIELARANNFEVVVSHRSGETEDNSISDLACSSEATQIKAGSMSRSDRLSKYNRLLVIEHLLGANCSFSGSKIFKNET